MLKKRLLVAIIIIPTMILMVSLGGWIFTGFLVVMLGYAAWEYWHMFSIGHYHPSPVLLVAGTVILILARKAFQFSGDDTLIAAILLTTMAWQVIQCERGCQTSAVDMGITIGGIFYLGWLGAYLVSLRELPDGLWWILIVIPAISFSDGGAYFVGSHFGRHKLSPHVSPNKTWEGYIGGIITGTLGAMLLASVWHLRAPIITVEKGLVLGLIISILAPMGDLGESMLKRNFGMKDSSNLLPGHGGIMDRVDSWLWAAPIGYFLIKAFWL